MTRLAAFVLGWVCVACSGSTPGADGSAGQGGQAHAGSGGSPSGGSGGVNASGASSGGASSGGSLGSGGGASFAEVQAIFNAHCTACHSSAMPVLRGDPYLSLIAADSKAALVNRPAHEACGGTYVIPGKPDQSYLFRKVSDKTPCEGAAMPTTIEPVPFLVRLSDADIATIRSWISAGAK